MILTQILFAFLLIGPIIWGIRNWRKFKKFPAAPGSAQYPTLINSAVLYALAFNVIFMLQEIFLVLGKKALGLTAFLSHNDHNWQGEHPMSSLMQGSGALAIFIIGLIFLGIFHLMRNSTSIWKLLILWLAFHGLIQSIPQIAVAYFDPNTDVGEALAGYLQLSQTSLMFLAVSSILATASISIWFSRPLLEFASSETDFGNPKSRFKYIRFIAVWAALLGSFLVVPFRIPPMSQAITPFIIFAFSIPWVWSSAALNRNFDARSNQINKKIQWMPIIILAFLLLLFQQVLAPGLEF